MRTARTRRARSAIRRRTCRPGAAGCCASAAASSAWPGRNRNRGRTRRVRGGSGVALRAGPAAPADAAHLVVVREQQEPVPLGNLVLQRLDPGLEEFDHLAALVADEMVVV